MKTIKNHSLWRMMVLLIVALLASVTVSSCKDKDDDPSSGLVGSWCNYDYGKLDYNDCFIFKSNGSFSYEIYDGKYDGTYFLDEEEGTLTILWEDDYEEELSFEFLSKDIFEISGYGTYKKVK